MECLRGLLISRKGLLIPVRPYFACSTPGHWQRVSSPIHGNDGSGKRNDVSNYRGIAILSAIAKLFELLVYRVMYEDLKGRLLTEVNSGWL
jgi:hypothetical protein